jgi:hypothetical protein
MPRIQCIMFVVNPTYHTTVYHSPYFQVRWWLHNIMGMCHALICFTCPCACLHAPTGVADLPHYSLGIYTCVLCLSVASSSCLSSQPVVCLSSCFSPVSLFLALLVLTLSCPVSEPACLNLNLPVVLCLYSDSSLLTSA